MATFTITTDGIAAGVVLTSPSTALFFGGVFDGADVQVDASPDNTVWSPVVRSVDLNSLGKNGGVVQCALPAGWYVRTKTSKAGASTNVLVVVA